MLTNSVIQWLLEDSNPAIKYRTLTELLDKSIDDMEVQTTYKSIWQQKSIQKILTKQNENGTWDTSDYGMHTSLRYLTALAEHGLGCESRMDRAIDYAVASLKEIDNSTGSNESGGCSNALLLRAIVMLGYHNRPDVRMLLDNYASSQLYDGGFMCKRLLDKKPERKSCYKASVAALLLYAACKQKGITFENTDRLTEYFIKRDVFYTSDKSTMITGGRPGWRFIDNFFPIEPMRIGLPLILSSLCILGVGDGQGMDRAWTILEDKKNDTEKLILEGTLSKQPCSFGKVGQENKWMTFYSVLADKYRL
ncbi:MAG: hypothetical protein K0S47_2119 [Herbinix sp.]|jgi:hypothetical protein|nr:hypothetical protein [Herbinix sp.]